MINPPGSRPGMRNLATMPTISPNMIHPIIFMSIPPLLWQRNLSLEQRGTNPNREHYILPPMRASLNENVSRISYIPGDENSAIGGYKAATTYEVRFQTVDPGRRSEYVKMYKQAIQEITLAGCRGGLILCTRTTPAAC